jgi:NitT/TauT family transport system ATP-binding protein
VAFATPDGATFVAVRDCSLAVRRGQFLSIVGPSGCGKSTLLFAMAGLYELSGGEILSCMPIS